MTHTEQIEDLKDMIYRQTTEIRLLKESNVILRDIIKMNESIHLTDDEIKRELKLQANLQKQIKEQYKEHLQSVSTLWGWFIYKISGGFKQ